MAKPGCIEDLTALDAARRLGTDLNYLYSQLRTGRLEGRKVDGRWRVCGTAVEERVLKRQVRHQKEEFQKRFENAGRQT
jgi:hypothetical protein